MSDATQILQRIEQGDPSAAEELLPLVYDELRRLAAVRLTNELPGQTLQATALVHEAYVRLVGVENGLKWDNGLSLFEHSTMSRRTLMKASSRVAAAAVLSQFARRGHANTSVQTDRQHTEVVTLSATEMVSLLKKKELSPIELVQAHTMCFAEIQPRINAVAHTMFADALRTAGRAEKAILRGRVDWKSRPLFGLPFSVKNHIDVRGVPTTAGAPAWKMSLAEADADIVRRLRLAGAIPLVTTNLPCLALSYDSDNLVFGRTNNPYDLERSAGGSSGGEGALVAACGSPLGVGSDHNGSIRLPSAWNGIAGLRPSPGRVSLEGMQPPVGADLHDAWAIGPMTRTVQDLEATLPFFTKCHAADGVPPLQHSSRVRLQDLRIRFLTKWNHGRGEPVAEIQETVAKSARFLGRRGAGVEEGIPEMFHRIGGIIVAAMLGADNFSIPEFRERMESLEAEEDELMIAAVDWIEKWQRSVPLRIQRADTEAFSELRDQFSAFMEEVDALLLPVHAEPAMKHGTAWPRDNEERCEEKYSYCYFCRLMGQHPAGTVRVGTAKDGLPAGVQVVGRKYREDIVLRILGELESEFGGWQPPELPRMSQ